jgi:exodeoxyribonuclease VII large subunit
VDDARVSLDLHMNQYLKHQKILLEGRRKLLLSLNPKAQILNSQVKLKTLSKHFDQLMIRKLSIQSERLQRVVSALRSIDPKNLLSRGYSILLSEKNQSVIASVNKVKLSEQMRILVSDGEILSTVNEIKPKNGKQ